MSGLPETEDRDSVSEPINRIVLVKFYHNNEEYKDKNPLYTRTLGKIGVISDNYRGDLPTHKEIWKVKIENETKPNRNKGCYILMPIHRIEHEDVKYLVPGLYTEHEINGCLLVMPNNPSQLWLYPRDLKATKKKIHSIIVSLDYESYSH